MLRVAVHVQPGAKVAKVGGSFDGRLKVAVTSRAVEGRATDEVLLVVAEAFGVKPRDVACVRGATSREKVLEVLGEAASLEARLLELLAFA